MLGAAWIAIKAWGLWSRIGSGLSALGGFAMRNPWPALAVVLLIGNGVQLVMHKRDRAVIAGDKAQLDAVAAAQVAASRAALAAHVQQEAAYQAKAKEADNAHQSELETAQKAADRYIADHHEPTCGVQPASAARSGGDTAASAQGGDPAVSASMPADAVVVSQGDVRACTAAVTYGIDAHNWATTINRP
jgi:hypothetical protein